MDVMKNMTFVVDDEVSEAWMKLRSITNLSFSEFMKEVLIKENLKYSMFEITDSIKHIAGTLQTQLDYKALREHIINERLKDYENIR